ncbi:MAG: UbiD family decarboxylase, partial [Dehalococcoidia bacterium]|nr:UbiD family decarboxylase [Dehalococcoidia bacterium]
GFPDVKKVWVDEMGHQIMAVISLKQRFAGQSKQIALCAAQSRALPVGRYIMVVDEDIDPANIRDVIWALCTRTDPIYDIDIIQRAWFSPLDPTVPERPAITLRSKAVIDACIPFERLNDYPDPIRTDPALIQNVKEKWGKALDLH